MCSREFSSAHARGTRSLDTLLDTPLYHGRKGVLLHSYWFPADFFLMGIHVQPSNAAVEIEALAPAYGQATQYYSSSRGVILGDMNAGCRWDKLKSIAACSLIMDL